MVSSRVAVIEVIVSTINRVGVTFPSEKESLTNTYEYVLE